MVINDRVYGTVNLEEPVLEELINSPSLNRLKDVSQYGIPDKYYCYKNFNFTYTNSWQGDVEQFSGEEKIFDSGKLIYKANYLGGLVDKGSGV